MELGQELSPLNKKLENLNSSNPNQNSSINLFLNHINDLEKTLTNILSAVTSDDYKKKLIKMYKMRGTLALRKDLDDLKFYIYCLQQVQKAKKTEELFFGKVFFITSDRHNYLLQNWIVIKKRKYLDFLYTTIVKQHFPVPLDPYMFAPQNKQTFSLLKKDLKKLFIDKPKANEAAEATWLFCWNFLRHLMALLHSQANANNVIACLTNNLNVKTETKIIQDHFPNILQWVTQLLTLLEKNENDLQQIFYTSLQKKINQDRFSLFSNQNCFALQKTHAEEIKNSKRDAPIAQQHETKQNKIR